MRSPDAADLHGSVQRTTVKRQVDGVPRQRRLRKIEAPRAPPFVGTLKMVPPPLTPPGRPFRKCAAHKANGIGLIPFAKLKVFKTVGLPPATGTLKTVPAP